MDPYALEALDKIGKYADEWEEEILPILKNEIVTYRDLFEYFDQEVKDLENLDILHVLKLSEERWGFQITKSFTFAIALATATSITGYIATDGKIAIPNKHQLVHWSSLLCVLMRLYERGLVPTKNEEVYKWAGRISVVLGRILEFLCFEPSVKDNDIAEVVDFNYEVLTNLYEKICKLVKKR